MNITKIQAFFFFFLRVEAISLILLESRTQQEKHPKLHGTEDSSPAPPDLEWGQRGVKQLGETLSLSPALQAPGLWEQRVMARQGPAPTSERLRWGFLERLIPLTRTPAHGAHSSQRSGHGHIHDWEAAGVEAGDTIIWTESVAGGGEGG